MCALALAGVVLSARDAAAAAPAQLVSTTITLASSQNPTLTTGTPSITATVTSSTGATPDGSVQFTLTRPDGSTISTSQSLSTSNSVSISLPESPLQAGTYTVAAQYIAGPSDVFASSTATALSEVVKPPLSITAPPDVVTVTSSGATTCAATLSNALLGTPTTSGATGAVTITRSPSGNVFAVGTTTVTWTATDGAANTATTTQAVIVVDDTAPTIVAPANIHRGTGPGATTATVLVSDADLGTASATDNCPGTLAPSRSGVPAGHLFPFGVTTITYTVADGAGNTNAATQTVTIDDTTAPTITGARLPAANAAGWNNTDVVVTFTCADVGSGIASCTSPVALSGDGAAQSANGTATDHAGNSTSTTVSGINIDKTKPVITYSGNAGAYTIDQMVVITCSASDGLSGMASNTCTGVNAPAYTLALGSHTLSATATDKAGNTGTASTTFTVGTTPTSLCTLTKQFVQSSAKYQALLSGLKAQIDQKVTAACASLALISPQLTPTQKAAAIAAYKLAVDGLVALGYLTPAQGTTLKALADTL